MKREGIVVSPERLDQHINTLAGTYSDPEQFRKWFRSNDRAMETAKSTVLEEQVIDWVLERAQVVEEPKSFMEIMEPGQAGPE
jgi:trigger factor